MKNFIIAFALIFMVAFGVFSQPNTHPQYKQMKKEQLQGWGLYNTRDMLSFVHLPTGYEVNLDFTLQGHNFNHYLNEVTNNKATENWAEPRIRAVALAHDFAYYEAQLIWADIKATIKAGVVDGELYVLYQPDTVESKWKLYGAFKTGVLWNKPGNTTITDEKNIITFEAPDQTAIQLTPTDAPLNYFGFNSQGPFFAFKAEEPYGVNTGQKKTLDEIKQALKKAEATWNQRATKYSENAEIFKAVNTAINFGVIYEPQKDRLISTVNRSWNVSRGGYSFFGWDNFMLGYMAALNNKHLAYSTVIEHLSEMTEYGFVPNCAQGNGRMTWDRSQPPVGSFLIKEIYKKYPEKWLIEATWPALYTWNQWWLANRLDGDMLCWGSSPNQNPYNDPRRHDLHAAALESGLDDSPMYDKEEVTFNTKTNLMELHDVGLNGLYVADCEALAEMAELIGKNKEAKQLRKQAHKIRKAMQSLWSEEDGIFVNKKTTTGQFYKRLSPTLFYAWNAEAATEKQTKRMLKEHFYNTNEFWGEYVLPSIAKNDKAFPGQKYWHGAIWAPLNFLVYFGQRYAGVKQAATDLAQKSRKLLLQEWRREGYVPENYCALNGKGDDPRIQSDPLYSWGALMGFPALIEAGHMPKPEVPINNK